MPAAKQPQKNALDIRLAESVVFLRAGDATGRHRNMQADAPPGMLRGLLTLSLIKPTRISSIEIELVGKTSTAWPEGVGARRIEVSEEHEIFSQSYVLFRAGSESPYRNIRRTHSVGPGLALDHDHDEEHSEESDEQESGEQSSHEERRGRDPGPPPASQNRTSRRPQSVDQTNFQRDFVSYRENVHPAARTTQSPPYTPPYPADSIPYCPVSPSASISRRMHTVEESPIQEALSVAEELSSVRPSDPDTEHSSLISAHHARSTSRLEGGSSASSLRLDAAQSARPSMDEERPEFLLGSSSNPLPLRSHSRSTEFHPRDSSRSADVGHRELSRDHDDGRGRKHKRFTLAQVSNALLDVVMDRVRSTSRSAMDYYHGDVTPPRGRTRERAPDGTEYGSEEGTPNRERSVIGRMTGITGHDAEEGSKEYGDGWKEFRKGVYTYPISFAIPASSPPTLRCEYGSVVWKLKATAHRPGTFTTKLSTSQEITVVACPSEDDLEETDSIIVERQWDTQMQYLISISGRSFVIGGTMPISITFMPWTKMKIYRISVLLEERVDYWTDFRRIARTDPVVRIPLMALKDPSKDGTHILPLDPDVVQAFERSQFSDLVPSGEDVSEYAPSLMGPGPWRVQKDLQLPDKCGQLHFTNRNRRSNIFVSHMLKVIFRVERGDDQAVDPQTGKRKLFDIVVQTPVHILSYLCKHDYISLPPYSRALEMPMPHSPSGSYAAPRAGPHPPLPDHLHANTPMAPGAHHVQADHQYLTPLSRQASIYERSTQFERLIAGQESEIGEAPPAYEEVVAS